MYTALLGCLTTPGLDGMRFALFLFKFSVFKDPYRKQVSRTKKIEIGTGVIDMRYESRFTFSKPTRSVLFVQPGKRPVTLGLRVSRSAAASLRS
jgi:hypothetical protein